MNKKITALLGMLTMLLFITTACSQEEDNKDDQMMLAALYVLSQQGAEPTPEMAVSSATSSIVSSAMTGSGSAEEGITAQGNDYAASAVDFSSSCTSTSTGTTCSGTINGQASCSLGGTADFQSVALNMTMNFNGAAFNITQNITSGSIAYSDCKFQYADYISGDMLEATVNGTVSGITSDYSVSFTNMSFEQVSDTETTYSSGFAMDINDSMDFSGVTVSGKSIADGSHNYQIVASGAMNGSSISKTTSYTIEQTIEYDSGSFTVDGEKKKDLAGQKYHYKTTCDSNGNCS